MDNFLITFRVAVRKAAFFGNKAGFPQVMHKLLTSYPQLTNRRNNSDFHTEKLVIFFLFQEFIVN